MPINNPPQHPAAKYAHLLAALPSAPLDACKTMLNTSYQAEIKAQPNINYIIDTHMQVIQVRGEQAEKFLQGQLSCDLKAVTSSNPQLGCYCNHQGRMLANFIILKPHNDYWIVLDASLVEAVLTTLKKFALFSKVDIQHRDELCVFAWLNASSTSSPNLIQQSTNDLASKKPDTTHAVQLSLQYNNTDNIDSIYVQQQPQLCWAIASHTEWQQWINTQLQQNKDRVQRCEQAVYTALLQQLGLTWITHTSSLLWTPHMINWPQLGGVSFTKGCFQGQEIIARTQNLGKLKRHLYRAQLDVADTADHHALGLKPGDSITSENTTYATVASVYIQPLSPTSSRYHILLVVEERACNATLQYKHYILSDLRRCIG